MNADDRARTERQAVELRRCWSVAALLKLNRALTEEYLRGDDWPQEFVNLKTAVLTVLRERGVTPQ